MSIGPGANASILATRLGNLAANQGSFDDARHVARRRRCLGPGAGLPGARRRRRSAGWRWPPACRADLDQAERLHREALAAYESVGSVEGAAFTDACLGFLATDRGDARSGTRAAPSQPGQGGAGQRTTSDGPRRGRIRRRARRLRGRCERSAVVGCRRRVARRADRVPAVAARGAHPGGDGQQVAARRRPLRRPASVPVASRPTRSSPGSSPTPSSCRADRSRHSYLPRRRRLVVDQVGDEDVLRGTRGGALTRARGPAHGRLGKAVARSRCAVVPGGWPTTIPQGMPRAAARGAASVPAAPGGGPGQRGRARRRATDPQRLRPAAT